MRNPRLAVFAIAMIPVAAPAQQFLPDFGPPVDPNLRFEVAAIKPFADAGGGILMRMTPGRFESSVPVGLLLRQALQKPDYRIVGAPGWIETTRYSITAKAPDGVSPTWWPAAASDHPRSRRSAALRSCAHSSRLVRLHAWGHRGR